LKSAPRRSKKKDIKDVVTDNSFFQHQSCPNLSLVTINKAPEGRTIFRKIELALLGGELVPLDRTIRQRECCLVSEETRIFQTMLNETSVDSTSFSECPITLRALAESCENALRVGSASVCRSSLERNPLDLGIQVFSRWIAAELTESRVRFSQLIPGYGVANQWQLSLHLTNSILNLRLIRTNGTGRASRSHL